MGTPCPARTGRALLGGLLLISVPLRRLLKGAQLRLSAGAELGAGTCFGFINGGMTGTGVVLISILMAAGVESAALLASDAIVSVVVALAKVALSGSLDALTLCVALIGLRTAAASARQQPVDDIPSWPP